MKKRTYYLLLLASFAGIFCACEDDTIDSRITAEEAAPFMEIGRAHV